MRAGDRWCGWGPTEGGQWLQAVLSRRPEATEAPTCGWTDGKAGRGCAELPRTGTGSTSVPGTRGRTKHLLLPAGRTHAPGSESQPSTCVLLQGQQAPHVTPGASSRLAWPGLGVRLRSPRRPFLRPQPAGPAGRASSSPVPPPPRPLAPRPPCTASSCKVAAVFIRLKQSELLILMLSLSFSFNKRK